MAFTRVQEIDSFDQSFGVLGSNTPSYWPEDILLLINAENPPFLVERNIIFQGNPISGLMSSDTDPSIPSHGTRIVLVRCPPFARPIEERFRYEPTV